MTITISRERMRGLLRVERQAEFDDQMDWTDDNRATEARMRTKYGPGWRIISDADMDREVAQ